MSDQAFMSEKMSSLVAIRTGLPYFCSISYCHVRPALNVKPSKDARPGPLTIALNHCYHRIEVREFGEQRSWKIRQWVQE
jgi:hypothetical protein